MIFPAPDFFSFFIFWFSMQNGYFLFTRFPETQVNPSLALCYNITSLMISCYPTDLLKNILLRGYI